MLRPTYTLKRLEKQRNSHDFIALKDDSFFVIGICEEVSVIIITFVIIIIIGSFCNNNNEEYFND